MHKAAVFLPAVHPEVGVRPAAPHPEAMVRPAEGRLAVTVHPGVHPAAMARRARLPAVHLEAGVRPAVALLRERRLDRHPAAAGAHLVVARPAHLPVLHPAVMVRLAVRLPAVTDLPERRPVNLRAGVHLPERRRERSAVVSSRLARSFRPAPHRPAGRRDSGRVRTRSASRGTR